MDLELDISIANIIFSVITALITSIMSYFVWKIKKKDEAKAIIDQRHKEELQQLGYKHQIEFNLIKKDLMAITRDRILQGYHTFKKRGSISLQELENMTQLYDAYHMLGGNGTITSIYKKICELPIKMNNVEGE